MTPHAELIAELHLVCTAMEGKAALLRAAHQAGQPLAFGTLEDHHTEVVGELLAVIDRVVPGLGTRLQAAMHPTAPPDEPEGADPTHPTTHQPAQGTAVNLSKPTAAQVQAEIAALAAMKPRVRQRTHFGDDNHAGIDAQLRVLREGMDTANVYVEFGEDTDEFDQHTLDLALQACDWLASGGMSPSQDWVPLTGQAGA